MKIVKLVFLAIMICFAIPFISTAQEVYFPSGIPNKPLPGERSGSMKAAILISKPIFLSFPSKRKGKSLPNPPDFLDVVTVYEKTEDDKYYLVKKDSGEWGWMDADEILTSPICMRSEEKDNPAFIKVLVKNNWRLKEGIIKEIPILEGPGANYSAINQINIFRIRYAFKIRKGNDGKNYVFVGSDATWKPESPSVSLKGWIKKDYCILWQNQVAVYYDKTTLKDRKPVSMFWELKDLKKHLDTGEKQHIIGREDTDFGELDHDTTRFPVIDFAGDMLKIAWVGDALHKRTKETKKKEWIDKRKGDIHRTIEKAKKVDILFLIDATKSMKPYFKPVAEGIKNYIGNLIQNHRSRFRFAFGVYRDYEDAPEDFQLLCRFEDRNLESVILQTAGKARSNQVDQDFPEAVFDGIYKGVSQVFPKIPSDKGHTRAVVVIGDHGHHNPPETKITYKTVADLLIDRHVAFYTLNVRLRSDTMSYSRLFQRQMVSILGLSGGIGENGVIKSTGHYELKETKNRTIIFLRKALKLSTETADSIRYISEEGASIEDVRRKYGTRVTNYMLAILREFGWTDNDIRLADFDQFCADGWVSKKDRRGVNQLEPYCLVKRTRFDMLIGLLARIKDATTGTDSGNVEDMVKGACQQATGDPILEGETISEYIQRIFYIPFRELSESLQYTPQELQDKLLSADSTFKEEFNKNIGYKYEQLNFVRQEKTGTLKYDTEKHFWKSDDTKPKQWFFLTADGMRFCWLPFKYLP